MSRGNWVEGSKCRFGGPAWHIQLWQRAMQKDGKKRILIRYFIIFQIIHAEGTVLNRRSQISPAVINKYSHVCMCNQHVLMKAKVSGFSEQCSFNVR